MKKEDKKTIKGISIALTILISFLFIMYVDNKTYLDVISYIFTILLYCFVMKLLFKKNDNQKYEVDIQSLCPKCGSNLYGYNNDVFFCNNCLSEF